MKAKFVYENINFERGISKQSLDLGLLPQIYKEMEEDNWSSEKDPNIALQRA